MKYSNDEAQEMFDSLSDKGKNAVHTILQELHIQYRVSGQTVDVPYFMWSIHKEMFEGVDPSEFLAIKDVNEFGTNAVYFISRFVKSRGV